MANGKSLAERIKGLSMRAVNEGLATEQVLITPDLARELLANNQENRTIKQAVVCRYATQILDGDWQLTHQGILLGKDLRLLDGQHRLSAIVLADKAVMMLVSWDNRLSSPVGVKVDIGVPRARNFIYGKDPRLWGVARLLASIGKGELSMTWNHSTTDDAATSRVCERIKWFHDSLARSAARRVSSSPIRAGAVLCMMKTDNEGIESVKLNYAALVSGNMEQMEPSVRWLFSQLLKNISMGGRGSSLQKTVMSWEAFSKLGRTFTRCVIGNVENSSARLVEHVKTIFAEDLEQ